MASLQPDIERAWLGTIFLLTVFIVLCTVLADGSWRASMAMARPEVASVAVESPAHKPAPATTELLFPLTGYRQALRDNFHEKRGLRTHKALDIMAPRGTPIRAVDGGRIAKLYRGPLAGISVYQFDPGMTRVYFYAHLDRYASGLEEGQAIARGDVIGYVGSTGNAPETAPHLHFAINRLGDDKRWWRGEAVNPYGMLLSAQD